MSETPTTTREPCPFLPPADPSLTWRSLARWRGNEGEDFYRTALAYGQTLWLDGLTARAILAVDRGLYADLSGEEAALAEWPWPYRAIGWLVVSNPTGVFMGNPRVHYQHLADRVRGERCKQKKWRAWAAWAVVRKVAPELPADPGHAVTEPSIEAIAAGLDRFGAKGETVCWQAALQ